MRIFRNICGPIALVLVLVLAGCGLGGGLSPVHTPEESPVAEVPAPQAPAATPAPPASQAATPASIGLEGMWDWEGVTYYIFLSGGLGTMHGMDIFWGTSDGLLSICATPDICGSLAACDTPTQWYYAFEGDELVLTSRDVHSMVFRYTRHDAAAIPPPVQAVPEQNLGLGLEGTWYWMGMPYYLLEAGGSGVISPGTDFETNILWSASNGIFAFCSTPELCGTLARCIAPAEWYYEIEGDELTLTSRVIPGMRYVYTRSGPGPSQ